VNKQDIQLPIILEQDEDGVYIVSCPLFRGCHSYGDSVEEAMKNIREVIYLCLEETPVAQLNRYIGYRELVVKSA